MICYESFYGVKIGLNDPFPDVNFSNFGEIHESFLPRSPTASFSRPLWNPRNNGDWICNSFYNENNLNQDVFAQVHISSWVWKQGGDIGTSVF